MTHPLVFPNNQYFNISVFVLSAIIIAWMTGMNVNVDDDATGIDDDRICLPGFFKPSISESCHAWLTCDDMNKIMWDKEKLIGQGAVKKVYYGKWRSMEVAINTVADPAYKDDFMHGLKMLQVLSNTSTTSQLVGFCNDIYITRYYSLGSLDKYDLSRMDLQSRFNMCIHYVIILNTLHHSPIGVIVMCDSNDLYKTLSQYLLDDEANLMLNDVDSLAVIEDSGIKCGHKELFGDFIAPEQIWPHSKQFNDAEMHSYDEKTDIWKIPDVCLYILGHSIQSQSIKFHLFHIHKRCKNTDPAERPDAEEVLEYYYKVRRKFFQQ